MRSRDEFIQIVQLGPAEIKQCRTFIQSAIGTCYSQIMAAYYESDVESLKTILSAVENGTDSVFSDSEQEFLKIILPLRIAVRTCSINLSKLTDVKDKMTSLEDHFQAEIYFVLAMAHEILNDDDNSFSFYEQSFKKFSEIGAFSKASKAFHNSIAAESRLEKHRSRIFIPDYLKAFEFSKRHNDILTAGQALTNVSKEYHRIGHLTKALKFALKAFRILEAEMNSYNFHLTTLNLSQLLIETHRYEEASKYMRLIEHSPYPDVLESIKALFAICNGASGSYIQHEKLPQNWVLKLKQKNSIKLDHFSEHERLIIENLAGGPQTRDFLIERLYGSELDYFSAESRFKNLMIRLKKKSPGIVEYRNQRYYLRTIA